MRGFSRFAAAFHFRAQILPKEQHEILSELIIRALELWQTSLDLIGVELLVEDEKGRPRRIRAWARALRRIIDEPGAPIRPSEALEEFERATTSQRAQLNIELDAYEDRQAAVTQILTSAIRMGEAALQLIGAHVSFRFREHDYTPAEMARLVQSGEIFEAQSA